MVLLAVLLAAVVVAVLALALVEIRRRLVKINDGLATLGSALEGVEAEHLRPLEGAVRAINAQFDIILGALPEIAREARSWPSGGRDDALVDRRRRAARRRAPAVVYLLDGVLQAARAVVPTVHGIATTAAAAPRTSTPPRSC